MRIRHILFLLAAVGYVSVGHSQAAGLSGWPVPGHDAQATNFNPDEQIIGPSSIHGLHVIWTYPHVIQAIESNDRVFALTSPARGISQVVALDARYGTLLKVFALSSLGLPRTQTIEGIAYAAGKLVIVTNDYVLAVNPANGRRLWRQAGGATFLTIDANVVYTGKGCQNPCGTLASYAFDLSSGRRLWHHTGNFGGYSYLIAGRLYQTWGQYSGETRVYNSLTGSRLGTLPLFAAWTGDQNNSYAEIFGSLGKPSWIGKITPTGRTAWKDALGVVVGGSPVFAYNSLFVPSHRFHAGLISINARTGKFRWGADIGQPLTLAGANHLIFALNQRNGRIDVLRADTGHEALHFALPRFQGTAGSISVAGGHLYATSANQLFALSI